MNSPIVTLALYRVTFYFTVLCKEPFYYQDNKKKKKEKDKGKSMKAFCFAVLCIVQKQKWIVQKK